MYNKGKLWNFITYLHSQERELDLAITYKNIPFFPFLLKKAPYTAKEKNHLSLREVLSFHHIVFSPMWSIILDTSNFFFKIEHSWMLPNTYWLTQNPIFFLRYFNSQMWQIRLSIKHKTEPHMLATSSPHRSMLRWDWHERIVKTFWQDLTYSGPGTTGTATRKICFFSAKPKYSFFCLALQDYIQQPFPKREASKYSFQLCKTLLNIFSVILIIHLIFIHFGFTSSL